MLISQTFMLASPWLIFLWVTHLSCFSSFFGLYLFIYSRAKVKHVANAQRTTRTVIYSIISKTHFAALLGCCCRLLLCDKYYFSRNVKRADLCTFIIIIKRLNLRSVDRSDYAKWQFIHYHFRCTLSSLCVRACVRWFVRWFVQMLSLQELKFALLCKYVRITGSSSLVRLTARLVVPVWKRIKHQTSKHPAAKVPRRGRKLNDLYRGQS